MKSSKNWSKDRLFIINSSNKIILEKKKIYCQPSGITDVEAQFKIRSLGLLEALLDWAILVVDLNTVPIKLSKLSDRNITKVKYRSIILPKDRGPLFWSLLS